MSTDLRLKAFLNDSMDVFQPIEHRHEIWYDDPFDVVDVHKEAREQFESLVASATTPRPAGDSQPGQILLLLGDSGAGKTHLLRVFRSYVHRSRLGFVGYMQLSYSSQNYARYILTNLIASLDQPYDDTLSPQTSLGRFATALVSRVFRPDQATMLRDDPGLSDEEVIDLVCAGADQLLRDPRFHDAELDLLRALLYLYRSDPRYKARILKFLRCEELPERDRKLIGGLVPWTQNEEDPERMIEQIGRLMGRITNIPYSLVFCLDQLEDVFDLESTKAPFRHALNKVRSLAERVPSSIFVVSCLKDAYENLHPLLPRSLLSRLTLVPPVKLKDARTAEEAKQLVAVRLQYLYASAGAPFDNNDPLYPFPVGFLEQQKIWRTRVLIEACQRFRQRCQKAGEILSLGDMPQPAVVDQERRRNIERWEQKWNTFLADHRDSPPEEDDPLAELLAWALTAAGEELETDHRFPTRADEGTALVQARVAGHAVEHLYVALCNRTAQFGWLGKQIAQHTKLAKQHPSKPLLVLARNDEFPKTPSVEKEIAAALKAGGRIVTIQDSDWRTLLALKAFRQTQEGEPWFAEWLKEENHLSRLPSIRRVLDLDHLDRFQAAAAAQPSSRPRDTHANAPADTPVAERMPQVTISPSTSSSIQLGVTKGLVADPVTMERDELTRHAAFLGGTGSGKTTLALGVIEQLLLQGIPVVMIDRKGDLAGYARSELWQQALPDPALSARRDALKAQVDVALYTPGHPEGRPVAISIAPEGLAEMDAFERGEAAAHAANALGDMLGYRNTGKDAAQRAILIQALQLLAETLDAPITLEALLQVIGEGDQALLTRVGRLDTKLFGQLIQNLETLKLTSTHLFATGSEPLDVDAFWGLGRHARPGKTCLTIISTKFLRDDSQIQFWVAQLLAAILRWTSKHPKDTLQAALLADEADLYLPALRQPATKLPMESLLKRGRSAGLSVLLATQSPGDLDYRCRDNIRTWFLGRIKEPTALGKLKPMFNESPIDPADRLPGQGTGEFYIVREGKVSTLRAHRSVLLTAQLSEAELLALARRTRDRTAQQK